MKYSLYFTKALTLCKLKYRFRNIKFKIPNLHTKIGVLGFHYRV